ncbi:MAG: RNA pseudouridine synthase [Planctomycetes bacterium]|nr:RNA pseudouridine synthase [Planctomycetota bacterium]
MNARDILYEDNHLLVVNKPAGLATMGAVAGADSLCEQARRYIKHKYQKPGDVYLGVVSRVDASVTGAVVFARTSKAAARLTEQFRSRAVEKVYWALVAGAPPQEGTCVDPIWKDDRQQRMIVVEAGHTGAQEARLRFSRRSLGPKCALLEVQLETGRKHQIRLQLSSRGWPILGDVKYDSRRPWPAGIALHSRRLVLDHPTRHEPIAVVAPLTEAWRRFGVTEQGQIGG